MDSPVWKGYDEAIRVPGERPPQDTPQTGPGAPDGSWQPPADWDEHDEFLRRKEERDRWDPKKAFPGNYHALPITVDVGWRPCLDCAPEGGSFYRRPGEISLWAGYAFQPTARSSAPFMAGGLEWIVARSDADGKVYGQSQLRPTWRWGWSFTAISLYASSGVILPNQDQKRLGYHLGVGASSIAVLALAACAVEAVPSVVELGWDFLPDPVDGRMTDTFVLKVGWGF